MAKEDHTSDFEKGRKEGSTDERMDGFDAHFAKINGSIDKFITLMDTFTEGMAELSSEIRTLQEEGRQAKTEVKVAAETLAKETERRRVEIVDKDSAGDRRFSKRDKIIGVILTILSISLGWWYSIHN